MKNFKSIKLLSNPDKDGGLRKRNIIKRSYKNKPLITVITATLNSEKYLQEAINSLQKQKYRNFEHIIVDGGSTDNTLNIIKKNEDKIDYWLSKKDRGELMV